MIDDGMMQALPMLKLDEGFRRSAYQDHLGYWTVGYGTMIDERRGGGLTPEEAEFILNRRVAGHARNLSVTLGPTYDDLSPVRKAVLLSMAYQLGLSGTLNFRRMVAALHNKDYDRAAAEMRDSKWFKYDTPKRAARLAAMMELDKVDPYYTGPSND